MPKQPKDDLTADRARELLSYDPATGELRWKVRRGGRVRAGSVAGSRDHKGYRQISIDRRNYRAHRIAWLLHFGRWPTNHIDHIDGSPENNAIQNLRDVTLAQNLQNQKHARRNSKTGVLGVSPKSGKYVATIATRNKRKHLGVFDTIAEAASAYRQAKQALHPFWEPPTRKANHCHL